MVFKGVRRQKSLDNGNLAEALRDRWNVVRLNILKPNGLEISLAVVNLGAPNDAATSPPKPSTPLHED